MLMTREEVDRMLVLPLRSEHRRPEVTEAVVHALGIVAEFAKRYGWSRFMGEPFFHAVEICDTKQQLWNRILELNQARDLPMPSDAVTAALENGVLLAVFREEAERSRPEYFRTHEDWVRALAHEIVHRLHVRILRGDEDAMGPQWFFEAFAVVGSDQPLGRDLQVGDVDEALQLTTAAGRGSYARYSAALRFFAVRVPLPYLVANAARHDFEAWLRTEVGHRRESRESGITDRSGRTS